MQWVTEVGLYHQDQMRWMRIDHALIMGLIERWGLDTNTFHLPSGEATITLEDVAYIYSLPIDGPLIHGRTYTHYKIDDLCQELLGVVPQKKEDYNWVSLKFTWLERVFRPTLEELREKKKPKHKGKNKKRQMRGEEEEDEQRWRICVELRPIYFYFFLLLWRDRFFAILQGHKAPFIF
ncbi:serine/threonine-protein phosphatase 7 long form [Cinnamomum micranthum f. kanehirae]|uniref:Serine/threonine-protein phosphatase 7 long form n=1 Tax=Cinnamomum micranthum f. kanehirae TaxID=337451 RepID=A0A443NCB3_9MAGN|nr:serine/threonine-protein phosphatase 7 long form [Cinnamomum micranthum f. kanehirae]